MSGQNVCVLVSVRPGDCLERETGRRNDCAASVL